VSIYDDPKEQEREDLFVSGVEAYPVLPDLAHRWLEVLLEDGALPTTGPGVRMGKKLLLRRVSENPANRSSDPFTSHALLDNGQTLWVRRAKRRGPKGYRSIDIVDKPTRTTKAVLAALTVLESQQVDLEWLKKLLPFVDPADQVSINDSLRQRFEELGRQGDKEGTSALVGNLVSDRPLRYAHALLRYYRPNFDALPREEQRELLLRCCERINKVLDSIRQLTEFLEYGRPEKDQRPAIENPRRDVEAAMLRDVEAMKYREIAESLKVEIPEKSRCVGDYSTVAKMVSRGRDILERAFTHDGWDEIAESMRADLSRWEALTEEEKLAEYLAKD
jgi:hypothetical protein